MIDGVKNIDYLIVGGGFFGCYLATHLAQRNNKVVVVEMDNDIMKRASFANQARVHNGYHYPRSLMTALRSRINFPKFCEEFEDCIVNDFTKYYAIGRRISKVSAKQYKKYFEKIGSPLEDAPTDITKLFNSSLIEKVWKVKEYAFDAVKLRKTMWNRLEESKVTVLLETEVINIRKDDCQQLGITCKRGVEELSHLKSSHVINSTYSHINQVLVNSCLEPVSLKHEITEMALITLPEEINDISVTVMCGPFFSFMPFPPKSPLYTLSHVRYTPHVYWSDTGFPYLDPYHMLEQYPKKSNYIRMIKDVIRYLPIMEKCEYVDSIWEVKTILPKSEIDDGRPILFLKDHSIKGLDIVLGGKIDNIYDVVGQYMNLETE